MKSLQNGGDESINQLSNMMGDLFKNMANNSGDPNAKNEENKADDPEMSKKLEEMFSKFEKAPHFDNFANKLLYEFMDKEILHEPLKDAKKSYESFLLEKAASLSKEEVERFQNQEKCIDELLITLEEAPENKDHLINLFEKMQEFGAPPEEITNSIEKDNPFKMFQNMQEMNENQKNNNANIPNMGNNECRLF